MIFSINFSKKALKNLEKIHEPYYSTIKLAVYELVKEPKPFGCKKLKGRQGYRIRVGHYRIIYDIFEKELVIDIITLGHRKDIYN